MPTYPQTVTFFMSMSTSCFDVQHSHQVCTPSSQHPESETSTPPPPTTETLSQSPWLHQTLVPPPETTRPLPATTQRQCQQQQQTRPVLPTTLRPQAMGCSLLGPTPVNLPHKHPTQRRVPNLHLHPIWVLNTVPTPALMAAATRTEVAMGSLISRICWRH